MSNVAFLVIIGVYSLRILSRIVRTLFRFSKRIINRELEEMQRLL